MAEGKLVERIVGAFPIVDGGSRKCLEEQKGELTRDRVIQFSHSTFSSPPRLKEEIWLLRGKIRTVR